MASPVGEWNVRPHGPIEKLAPNLWRVWGSVPGMTLKRTMAVARRDDGRLVIHSAIALDEPSMTELETWGKPAFKRRYPDLRVYAPAGSRAKVESRIAVDGTYDDFPGDASVKTQRLAGVNDIEGVVIVRSPDGTTVVVNDAVFNMDRKRDILGFLFTAVMGSAPGPRVSRLFKVAAVKDKNAMRADLRQRQREGDRRSHGWPCFHGASVASRRHDVR
jgi:hypothetical protein